MLEAIGLKVNRLIRSLAYGPFALGTPGAGLGGGGGAAGDPRTARPTSSTRPEPAQGRPTHRAPRLAHRSDPPRARKSGKARDAGDTGTVQAEPRATRKPGQRTGDSAPRRTQGGVPAHPSRRKKESLQGRLGQGEAQAPASRRPPANPKPKRRGPPTKPALTMRIVSGRFRGKPAGHRPARGAQYPPHGGPRASGGIQHPRACTLVAGTERRPGDRPVRGFGLALGVRGHLAGGRLRPIRRDRRGCTEAPSATIWRPSGRSAQRGCIGATPRIWGCARPGSAGPAFDIAFLDPPYAKGLGETALAGLAAGGRLAPGALVVFEAGRGRAGAHGRRGSKCWTRAPMARRG